MKRFGIVILLLVAAMLAGCSQFQARGESAIQIDACARAAPGIIAQVNAHQLSAETCQRQLATNSTIMQNWVAAKTTSGLAYVFSDKTIFVNQDYSDDLDKAGMRFQKAYTMSLATPLDAGVYLIREEKDFIKFKAARDGRSK